MVAVVLVCRGGDGDDGEGGVDDGVGGGRRLDDDGGDGAVVEGWQRRWRRVVASECGDRIDRVMGSIFGFGRKSPPENFSGGGGVMVAGVNSSRWWGRGESLITQEASGSLEDLEIIQEEDTHPSIDTSLNHEEDDLEIDEPQSDIIPIRRSTRTRRSKDSMCLFIDDCGNMS
ncbi:hypothetical protein Tco_0717118 [Tanacetum coccineum]